MCTTFSRNQYISVQYLNANLRDFLKQIRIKGTSDPAKGLFTKNGKARPRATKNRRVLGKK